jgi:hypothetical protein
VNDLRGAVRASLVRTIDLTMNDCYEAAAKICEVLGDKEFAKLVKSNMGIAAIAKGHYTKCAEAIRAFKMPVENAK